MNIFKLAGAIALTGAVTLMSSSVFAKDELSARAAPDRAVIYVTTQGLYYDSILLGTLPYNGTPNFQLLDLNGPMGPQTEFGPRDRGYFGGRWWVDANENGTMDEDDVYFLCPLIGPGRVEP